MNADITTVTWKELTEIRRGGAGGNRSLIAMIMVTLFLSVIIPFSSGSGGANGIGGIGVMAIGALVAAVWVLTTVPDAFAGERDRHTLETLLSTRLPARAILLGKAAANVVCASALGVAAMILAVISGNIGGLSRHGQTGVDIPFLELGVGLILLVATTILLTNLGILIALRASSALNAQRALGLSLAALTLGVSLGVQALPKGMQSDLESIGGEIGSLGPGAVVAITLVVLVVVNVALVAATLARFTRPKLIRR